LQASAHCVAEARVSDNSTKFFLTHVSVLPDHAKKNSQIQATTATATAKAPNGNSEWARRRRLFVVAVLEVCIKFCCLIYSSARL